MEHQLSNATVVTFRMDSDAAQVVADVVSRYDSVIGSHPNVTRSTIDRDKIVVTTDMEWYSRTTGNSMSALQKLGGQMGRNVDGQYTIWLKDKDNPVSAGLVLHEIMHTTHPGLGARQPHKPEFYLSHGELMHEMGLPPDTWNGPARSDFYNSRRLCCTNRM